MRSPVRWSNSCRKPSFPTLKETAGELARWDPREGGRPEYRAPMRHRSHSDARLPNAPHLESDRGMLPQPGFAPAADPDTERCAKPLGPVPVADTRAAALA